MGAAWHMVVLSDSFKAMARRLVSAAAVLALGLGLLGVAGCAGAAADDATGSYGASQPSGSASVAAAPAAEGDRGQAAPAVDPSAGAGPSEDAPAPFDLSTVPPYSGSPFVEVDGGIPSFAPSDATGPAESYSPRDALGRCGTARAIVGTDTMPTEERGSIGMVKPTGWHTVRYDDLVDGRYLYNRCHLIGYQLTGENANEDNLITGTRYLNVEGMLPFENEVADYVRSTGNHVLYRVTPVFAGDELLARGVHMEARSVEDDGAGVRFNVFCYNVQPGVILDYATGESRREDGKPASGTTQDATGGAGEPSGGVTLTAPSPGQERTYVLNTNTMKFHDPECSSVGRMSERNKRTVTASRDEIIAQGYSPCGNCEP